MGYVVKEEDSQTGEVLRQGPFVTEQEARRSNANGELYDWSGSDPIDRKLLITSCGLVMVDPSVARPVAYRLMEGRE